MSISDSKGKNIKRFDFEKRPHRPSFLMQLAKWIICWPDLKKRGAIIDKHDMEGIDGKPYILLVTHSSMVDFSLMLRATHPDPVNNVMTLEGFNTYTEPLMRSLGVLGKRKFISDLNLIRNMKYCLEELKTVFVLFPEARYSLDGCTSHLPTSLGKLVKMMKIPVVMLKIHGNFITCPQWNKVEKKTKVTAEMYPLFSPEELKQLTVEDINGKIRQHFQYDDFAWQYENRLRVDHPKRAEGLHCLLYKCPNCMTEGETDSSGSRLWCNACGKQWEMDEFGRMKVIPEIRISSQDEKTEATLKKSVPEAREFSHIPDWTKWERACVREEIRNGTYYFEDTIRLETLPSAKKFYRQGEGKLIQTPQGTRIECSSYYGTPYVLEKGPLQLESVHIEYDYLGRGDCVDISIPDDSFWCYLSKRDAITKLSFATEEIYYLALEQKAKER